MSARAAIVVQARMGSSRLPGKSLAPIAGRSLLAHVVERLADQRELPVVLATTTLLEDDLLCDEADRLGIAVLRGSADDVLGRYHRADAPSLSLTSQLRCDSPGTRPFSRTTRWTAR